MKVPATRKTVTTILLGSLVSLVALGLGSCVYDRATATLQAAEVTVIDKHYSPAHSETVCSGSGGHRHCRSKRVGPSWTVRYAEGAERHSVRVPSDMFGTLNLGGRYWLRYQKGGYWGFRYSETFLLARPDGEAPTSQIANTR